MVAFDTQDPALEEHSICARVHKVGVCKDWIGDGHSFVLPGSWDNWAGLVALVAACVALLVEFPLDLQFR
jgi:hypothetical protein